MALGKVLITEDPWRSATRDPQIAILGSEHDEVPSGARINSDFENLTAGGSLNGLETLLRTATRARLPPIHKVSMRTGATLLAGFQFRFEQQYGSPKKLELSLYHDDMRRLGSHLADLFCQSLSGGDRYFEEEAGTARLHEAVMRG